MATPPSAAEFAQLVAAALPITTTATDTWTIRKQPLPRPLSADSIWMLTSPDGPMVALTFRDWPNGRRGKLRVTLELPTSLRECYGDDPALPRPEFKADATPRQVADKISTMLLPKWPDVYAVAQKRKAEYDAYRTGCQAVSTALVAELGDDLTVLQGWDFVGLRPGNGLVDGTIFIRSPNEVAIQLSVNNPDIAVALARVLAAALSTPDNDTAT